MLEFIVKDNVVKKILNVLHQSDDGYAKVCGMSIVSMLENNKHLDEINIYYVGYKLTQENIDKLHQLVEAYRNTKLTYIDGEKYHNELKRLNVKPWRGIYVTWLKLLALADLKLNTDRVLYVNAHTIINSALDELLDFDFKDNTLALSYDCILNDHKQTIGLRPTDGYYNCGVMLINYKKWIQENKDEYVKKKLSEKSDYVIVDQDFCNDVFRDDITLLPATYNFSSAYYGYDLKGLIRINKLEPKYFYTYDELMEVYYAPKIIHSLFGLVGKPWEVGSEHPNRHLWLKYLRMTPWSGERMPEAKRNINWLLYKILPMPVFLRVYRFAVKGKYGSKKRNKLLLFLDKFTPQKGT